jgi:hypothetical protein
VHCVALGLEYDELRVVTPGIPAVLIYPDNVYFVVFGCVIFVTQIETNFLSRNQNSKPRLR